MLTENHSFYEALMSQSSTDRTITLTVDERIALINMLPSKGNYHAVKCLKEIKDKIFFSMSERQALGMSVKDGFVAYSVDASSAISPEFSDDAISFLSNFVRALSEKNQLSEHLFNLYERLN